MQTYLDVYFEEFMTFCDKKLMKEDSKAFARAAFEAGWEAAEDTMEQLKLSQVMFMGEMDF